MLIPTPCSEKGKIQDLLCKTRELLKMHFCKSNLNFFGTVMGKRWMQCPQVCKDTVIIKNVLKIRSLVPESRETRAAVWQQGHTGPAGEFFVMKNQTHVHIQTSQLLPLFSLFCALVLCLFCLLHAFSSLRISSVVSPSTKFTQPSSITLRIRICAFEKPSFSGSSFQLLLTPQVTLLEQLYFDTVPLAAIRIKSAPGCL